MIHHSRRRRGEGGICGLHALNNILQGDAVPIALSELTNIAVRNKDPAKYQRKNFSVKVLLLALESRGWTLGEPWEDREVLEECIQAEHPAVIAFLLHRGFHFFALRKIGDRWFKLDSSKPRPFPLENRDLDDLFRYAGDKDRETAILPVLSPAQSSDPAEPPKKKQRPSPVAADDAILAQVMEFSRMEQTEKDAEKALREKKEEEELARVLEQSVSDR